MRNNRLYAIACGMVIFNFGTATRASENNARFTPIVKAVKKTQASIVTVIVEKKDSYGQSRESKGTGVIVDERGYIITNNHVVKDGFNAVVRLWDKTAIEAQIVATDPRGDLAIVRIKTDKKLQALPVGPGSDVMVGETVIAVGHPYGYTNTVSKGIISATGRSIRMGEVVLSDLLQTDASINPGNSGGPLLNINGELIGINVALREDARGIAFAINADTVKKMLSKHLSALKVAGVRHGLACKEQVAQEGNDRQRVVVAKVSEGTPAADAGLKTGDEILQVGKKSVSNRFDLERSLWDHKPGQKVQLKVVRQGKTILKSLTLRGKSTSESLVSR